MNVKSPAAAVPIQFKSKARNRLFIPSRFSRHLIYLTPLALSGWQTKKQVALGEAYARSGVICRVFRGIGAERFNHEHVLAVFAGTAASLSGAQRSDRQRSRRGLLPLPLLLSVSTKCGGGGRAIHVRVWACCCLCLCVSHVATRSGVTRARTTAAKSICVGYNNKPTVLYLLTTVGDTHRYLVSAIADWAPHWLPACLWYSFLMQMFCTSNHQYKVIGGHERNSPRYI